MHQKQENNSRKGKSNEKHHPLDFFKIYSETFRICQLKASLSPMSVYHFGIDKKILPNQKKWNIK